MPPIRRYLRITRYSVLECRIYLDEPALEHSWLLNPRAPVLPRVFESVRPLVLPKLREEKERGRKKSTKKKAIKDVVVEDDFEVSIFLTRTTTRHALLTKHKHFHDTTQTKLTSNSGRLIGATNEAPVDLEEGASEAPLALREEDDSDEGTAAALAAIPEAPQGGAEEDGESNRRAKRALAESSDTDGDDDDGMFVVSESDAVAENDADAPRRPRAKRQKGAPSNGKDVSGDDKKKLAMDVSYDGFSIYGRVLCLVIKRRKAPDKSGGLAGALSGAAGSSGGGGGGGGKAKSSRTDGHSMMENFIISTQLPAGVDASGNDGS